MYEPEIQQSHTFNRRKAVKYFRIAVISLFFLILTASTACSFSSSQAQAEQQVTVTRGDLAIKVNGSGKAGYAKDARLSFGTAGKIEKVNVKKGDMVDKGSVLAILNTDALELTLSQAQTDEAKAQLISIQSRTALVQAEIGEAEASHALTAAQFNLDKIEDVGKIKDKIMDLEWQLKIAETNRSQAQAAGNTSTVKALNDIIRDTNSELDRQNQKLQDLLSQDEYAGVAPYEVKSLIIGGERYDRLLVEDIRMKQQQVLLAEKAVEQARQNIELAKLNVEHAAKAVQVAQKQLDEAAITTPINGTAVTVDIKEGDTISPSGMNLTAPIYIIDTNSMQVTAQIDEIDIPAIRLGQ
jgi:HlyD family secretion protein